MNQKTILIMNGTVVDRRTVMEGAAVLIRGETIAAVGNLEDTGADEVLDAKGLLVLPGAIDPHVHFNETNKDQKGVHDYLTGGRAAAFGGTTTIVDFADQIHGEPLLSVLDVKKDQARGQAVIDWNVHPIINQVTPEVLEEIPEVVAAGLPTIKCFMTFRSLTGESAVNMYSGKAGPDHLGRGLRRPHLPPEEGRGHAHGPRRGQHHHRQNRHGEIGPGPDPGHRPCPVPSGGGRSQRGPAHRRRGQRNRIAPSTSSTSRPFDGLNEVTAARAEGLPVWAETCPHFLIFTDEKLKREDGYKWLGSPPLRDEATQAALWDGLGDGRISVAATDDCAFSLASKVAGAENFELCPEGMPGIEPRLTILYSEGVAKGRHHPPAACGSDVHGPSQAVRHGAEEGQPSPGADADIVLFDPSTRWTMSQETLHMASDYTSYEGVEVTGKVAKVFSRGELIVDGEEFLATPGRGRFLACALD